MRSDTTGFWTPVALSADLPTGSVLPAIGPSGAVALWRSAAGHVAASADRCPHRGMSLSHGFVRGEVLSCIYHGWSYGMTGRCVRIPAHPGLTPPDAIRVATYETQESGGVIWMKAEAPASRPPSLEGLVPLRSLTIEARRPVIETIAGTSENQDGLIETTRDGQTLYLLLGGPDDGRTLVHVLVAEGSSAAARIAASRSVEAMRRQAEETAGEETAGMGGVQ